MKTSHRAAALAAASTTLLLGACGGGSSPSATATTAPPPTAAPGLGVVTGQTPTATVDETNALTFSPSTITVPVGGIVQWTNTSTSTSHNVTFNSGLASSTMAAGQTYQVKFTKAGTYAYVCTFHVTVGMTGTVKVTS